MTTPKMKPIIETEDENRVALSFIERLMDSDPPKDSRKGKLLSLLEEEVRVFEKRYDDALTPPPQTDKPESA